MTGFQAFNLKEILQTIRERNKEEIEYIELGKEENTEEELGNQKKFLSYLNDIPDNITVEELPVYQDYLSKFTLSPFFRDKPLLTKSEVMLSKADGDFLLKLVCGSLASTYNIAYNEEKGGIELVVHVDMDDGPRTGMIEDLWQFQIDDFFEIYLHEQLSIEFGIKNNLDKDFLEEGRGIRLVVFEQKMRALEEKYRQAQADNEDIDAELDELLES